MSLATNNRPPARGRAAEVTPYEDVTSGDMPGSTLAAFNNSGIDVQIATAHRFPRSISQFLQEAEDLVTANAAVARSCTYALPRGGKNIVGPSVRMAELLAYAWGNLRTAATISNDDGKFVTATAIGMDLQKNVGFQVEARRRVTTKDGKRFDDDMVAVTCNAAISIALRNAIFRLIPKTYVDTLHEMAQGVALGKIGDMDTARREWVGMFTSKGVAEKDLFRVLDVKGIADITSDHLIMLQGFQTSIREGMTTLDDLFAPPAAETLPIGSTPGKSKAATLAEKVAPKAEVKPAELPPEPGSDG